MIALLIALLSALSIQWGTVAQTVAPAPPPAGERPAVVAHPSRAPQTAPVPVHRPRSGSVVEDHAPEPTPAPTSAALDPEHPELAPQLPAEVIGRAIDCPDGSPGHVVDEELHTDCR